MTYCHKYLCMTEHLRPQRIKKKTAVNILNLIQNVYIFLLNYRMKQQLEPTGMNILHATSELTGTFLPYKLSLHYELWRVARR